MPRARRAPARSRLRRCAAAGCGRWLVDTSRNQSRRYCEHACASRTTVAAYRARQKAGAKAGAKADAKAAGKASATPAPSRPVPLAQPRVSGTGS
jgi:CGNR zinc finger